MATPTDSSEPDAASHAGAPVLFYYDPLFLEHDTGVHPECAARIVPLAQRLEEIAAEGRLVRPTWSDATLEQLMTVHGWGYVERVEHFAHGGGGVIEQDTVVSDKSYDAAVRAVGAACDAVQRVVRGEARKAFCLVRPPGHHALADAPMGFCLFNNVAVAAALATRTLGLQRVMVVDWDVHHGNGTQASFWDDPRVAFYSSHRWPFYPGTGDVDEVGGGAGKGTTCNLPVRFGTPRREFLARFADSLGEFAAAMRPELVLISAGFDAHRVDPIGSLSLETEDFGELTRIVLETADAYADGRVVSLMEGGYHPTAVLESAGLHVEELIAAEAARSGGRAAE
jgi:acetoin utilization deacetylase AcuC-like enzyme